MKYVINNQQDSLVQSINKNVALVFGSFSDSRGKQEKTDLDEAVIVAQETAAWGYGVAARSYSDQIISSGGLSQKGQPKVTYHALNFS